MFLCLFNKRGGGELFFPLFKEQSALISKAADILVEILEEESFEKKKELARKMKEVEREGDVVDAKISEILYKTRRVPFDREDVQTLASRMESFLDMIHDSAKKIVIYRPNFTDSSWIEIGEQIVEDARLLTAITGDFEQWKKKGEELKAMCGKIKEIESEVDDIYENYMSHLFEAETNGIELTKCKNIVQSLEDTTDVAKEIGDCIKLMLVKEG
ncbi:MAG: DUF47 family protein [Bacteroidales bacterium]|nr:DUF47 family protein [Bacteroidales bacterium]